MIIIIFLHSHFLYQFVKDYGERKLEGVRFHDVSIMGHSGLDELKGSRNVKIILSIMNNLYPHINTTQTDDNRIILHLHSFMSYVREEGRRYQAFSKKGKKFDLQINVNKVIQECFSNVTCEDSCRCLFNLIHSKKIPALCNQGIIKHVTTFPSLHVGTLFLYYTHILNP